MPTLTYDELLKKAANLQSQVDTLQQALAHQQHATTNELIRKNQSLSFLSKVLSALNQATKLDEVYSLICEKIAMLNPEAFIVVEGLNEQKEIYLAQTAGLDLPTLQLFERETKIQLATFQFHQDWVEEQRHMDYEDQGFWKSPSLSEFLLNLGDKEGCDRFSEKTNISGLYHMGIRLAGKPFGGVAVIARNGKALNHQALCENITKQAFIVAERILTSSDLRKNTEQYKSLYQMVRLMCDNVPEMIWAKDMDQKYIFVNRELCNNLLNANDTNEPIGKNELFFAERERKAHSNKPNWHTFNEIGGSSHSLMGESDTPMRFEESGNIKGIPLYLDIHIKPLIDANGIRVGTVGSARNVTKKKAYEQQREELFSALQDSELRYKTIFNTSKNGLFILSVSGEILFVNPAVFQQHGFGATEMLSKHISLYLKFHNNSFGRISTKIQQGHSLDLSATGIQKNGNSFDADTYWCPLMLKGVTHIFVSVRDISEQKRYQEKLLKAKEEAESADMLKSIFLGNVSHEIRTPMNGIVGYAELLKEGSATQEEKSKYIRAIEDNSYLLLKIIEDIIEISRIETGEIQAIPTQFELLPFLNFIVETHGPKAESLALDLVVNYTNISPGFIINTDAEKLKQILENLISNALKFTNSGKVSITVEKLSHNLHFKIEDTGIGISAKDQDLIFDRFRQADICLTRNYGGTGLGLAICKSFVELLGGHITLRSKKGKGSTFSFTIPHN